MKTLGKSVLCIIFAIVFSISPAFAGKNKTFFAWNKDIDKVSSSISDQGARDKIEALNDTLGESYGGSRSEYYAAAAVAYKGLIEISTKHGGPDIKIPDWLQ